MRKERQKAVPNSLLLSCCHLYTLPFSLILVPVPPVQPCNSTDLSEIDSETIYLQVVRAR